MSERTGSTISRRRFLSSAAAACAGITYLADPSSARAYALNDRLGIALVGVSGRGSWFVGAIPRTGENVVAMCDVNEKRAAEAYGKFPEVPKFRDFRRMLDKLDRDIDAVVIATPDNTHAVISMTAMKAGKHVYCEKPLTHDVHEARALREMAARSGVVTQMGNQGTASEGYRRALGFVRGGAIGEVREVYAWKDGGGQGERPLPKGSEPVPDYLAWDVWLGPAAARPYHPQWMRWHGWRDFGTGEVGNWGCHIMNLPFRALKLDELWGGGSEARGKNVTSVRATCSGIHAATFPRSASILHAFPARGDLPPVRLTWFSGLAQLREKRAHVEKLLGRPLDFGDHGRKKWDDHGGCLLVGSKGSMHLNAHNTTFTLLPEGRFRGVEEPPRFALRSPGHEQEWIRACKGGEPAMAHFGFAAPLTELVLLQNVATRFERPLRYDPAVAECPGDEEASAALRREYREGWTL